MFSSNGGGPRAGRGQTIVGIMLGVSALASAGFMAVFVAGAQTQLAALCAFAAFAALAAAFVVWEGSLLPHPDAVEEREPLPSAPAAVDETVAVFEAGARALGRRSWLMWLLGGTLGALGLAGLFPLASLTGPLDDSFAHTAWRRGLRLVREDGTPVHASDLAIDSVVTVFPEGFVGPEHVTDMANAATMLVRVPVEQLALAPERMAWAPGGLLAYSKVCTHAGCPVGLYRAAARELFCPCHHSTFAVCEGAKVVFGPAARPLPQLPIAVAGDGTLHALGDFDRPVGPGYWNRA